MIDIKNIVFKIANDANYSFVGLKRGSGNELEFWLPKGFENFERTADFEKTKTFFFKMYRTFQVYKRQKSPTADRDGVVESENGFNFKNDNYDEIIFYGKLKALDKVLDGYDELRIDALEKKEMSSNQIDYSKIHKYMYQAIYLDDDVIYLDEMNIAKNMLVQTSPSIIQLFCFIYTEVKNELEALEIVPPKAIELAAKFKQTYLQPNSCLFAADTFADTLHLIKAVFDNINDKTTYKDEDFWHFYDAIEVFLNGEEQYDDEGIYFGVNQFYDVWEDMCQTYMVKNSKDEILFADGHNIDKFKTVHPFKLKMNGKGRERQIKPDLVLQLHGIEYFTDDEIFNKICKTKCIETDTYWGIYNNQKVTLLVEDNKIKMILENHLEPSFGNIRQSRFSSFKETVIKEVKSNLLLQEKIDLKKVNIIDYKYMSVSDFKNYDEKKDEKLRIDIRKQLLYEWAIQ
ncbi:MAG: hypothetical protein RL329_2442, partial [Bacteroidota bacterium]